MEKIEENDVPMKKHESEPVKIVEEPVKIVEDPVKSAEVPFKDVKNQNNSQTNSDSYMAQMSDRNKSN